MKFKAKYICIIFILIIMIGMFAVLSTSQTKRNNQKKSDNTIDKNNNLKNSNTPDYEFYLSNNPIKKMNDKYNLLNSIATISNDYTNSFINNEYGIYEKFPNLAYFDYTTDNKNKYQLHQSYYNTSNENSFKSYDDYDYNDLDKRNELLSENINIVSGSSLINGTMLENDTSFTSFVATSLYTDYFNFETDEGLQGLDISFVDLYSGGIDRYVKCDDYFVSNEIVMMLRDDSTTYQTYASRVFEYGVSNIIVEFMFRTNDSSKDGMMYLRDSNGMPLLYFKHSINLFYVYSNSAWNSLGACNSNVWYKIKFISEIITDTTHIYINDVDKSTWNNQNKGNNITQLYFSTFPTQKHRNYFDNISLVFDNIYSNGLEINMSIDISSENIESLLTSDFVNLQISDKTNISSIENYNVYIYNFEKDNYVDITLFSDKIKNFYIGKNKEYYNFSKYFENNSTNFKIIVNSFDVFKLIIDSFFFIFSDKDYSAYVKDIVSFNAFNSTRYMRTFESQINFNKTYLYSVIKIKDNENSPTSYTFSNTLYIFENIISVMVNRHIYYGMSQYYPTSYNTTNIMIEIIVNNNNSLKFTEYHTILNCKYGYLTNPIRPNANLFNISHCYISDNFNIHYLQNNRPNGYFDNGNYTYCYNSLQYVRIAKGNNYFNYSRFLVVNDIDLNIPIPDEPYDYPDIPITGDDNPLSETDNYWSYTAYRVISDDSYNTTVGNWSIEFNPIKVESYTIKWYYIILESDNNIFGAIANAMFLMVQFLAYGIVAILTFVFTFIGCYILVLLWNICVYYIYLGLAYIVWFLWLVILACLAGLLWLWSNVIYPFLEWCYTNLIPAIVEAVIMILAFCIALIIYCCMLGTVDLFVIYYQVYDIIWLVVDFILDIFAVFVDNLPSVILLVLWYFLCAGMLYFRYVYCRARGFQNKAERCYYTFQIYIAPIVFIYNFIKKILEMIPMS